MMDKSTHRWLPGKLVWAVLGIFIAGCAGPAQSISPGGEDSTEPVSQIRIYAYPQHGQPAAQQDRDYYECYLWAADQSGFDPSSPALAPHQRVTVEMRPAAGHDTAVGAVTGGVLGAVVGAPHRSGEGFVVGAVTGALLGAVSDSARQEQAAALQNRKDNEARRYNAALERKAADYRRALKACLDGRGYSVR